jgi:hypothetical protein
MLRNVRSKPNWEVSILLIRSWMQAINCSSLELNVSFSLWGPWLIFKCYRIVTLKDAVHHRGKGRITLGSTPPLCPSRWASKDILKGNDTKGTWKQQCSTVLLQTLMWSTSGQWLWSEGSPNLSKLFRSPQEMINVPASRPTIRVRQFGHSSNTQYIRYVYQASLQKGPWSPGSDVSPIKVKAAD